MERPIRIGTRESPLALWQANAVQRQLNVLGFQTEMILIKSVGDLQQNKPLYKLGITGIFTKTLDTAILNNTIDIAVHSLKDVPTTLPNGILQGAVLKRGTTADVLIYNGNLDFLNSPATIATGSLRRKTQWLNRYPQHTIKGLRGNVNTRLKKLTDNPWQGAIFALAGLKRINVLPKNHLVLDWMIPAPAQGAIMITVGAENDFCKNALKQINHKKTAVCTHIERQFLNILEGGCTAPIGALAVIDNQTIYFKGVLLSLDAKEKFHIEETCPLKDAKNFGKKTAQKLLKNGGSKLIKKIKTEIKQNT